MARRLFSAAAVLTCAFACDGNVSLGSNGYGALTPKHDAALSVAHFDSGTAAGGAPNETAGLMFLDGGPPRIGAPDASQGCVSMRQVPETVVVYRDATVYTHKPFALFIMLDRSTSMLTGNPSPWSVATQQISDFVRDTSVEGIDMGLGVFPVGPTNTASCSDGSDCGTPVVPIGPLPGNGNAVIQALGQQAPNGQTSEQPEITPLECGLRGMINQCLSFMAASPIGEQCVAVLITDGVPTQCDTDHQHLVQIIADGHSRGVITLVLGLPGVTLDSLNDFVGGPAGPFETTGSDPVVSGMRALVQKVIDMVDVVHTTTVTTPLPCHWKIPTQEPGTVFDYTKVNVQFIAPNGTVDSFGYVASQGDCARVIGDAWYYDDPMHPTEVIACPNTCSGTLHNSAGAGVQIDFGCPTHVAPTH